LALLAVLLGFWSVSSTLASTLATSEPARAAQLAPGNGRIEGLLAQQLVTANVTPSGRARAERLAQKALRHDATSVEAVVALGLGAELAEDHAKARRLFAYSERLSRRNLPTQLWAVEDTVARGDIPGALRHYDIALRTSKAAQEVMFPVLVSAIGEASIRSALVRTLAHRPGWWSDFVDYVAVNGSDLPNSGRFFLALRKAGIAVPAADQAAVTDGLLKRQMISEAWEFYAATHPGAERSKSRDPEFRNDVDSPTGFDWNTVADGGIDATIRPGDGMLDFSVPASIGGAIVQQVQMLPAGKYLLTGRSAEIDQAEGARPYWMLSCANGRELGRLVLPDSDKQQGRFSGQFTVPQDCPVQTLALIARPSDAVGGGNGQIRQVLLHPM